MQLLVIENSLEVVNVLIGLLIVGLGFPFLNRLRFSLQKRAVRFFLIAIFLFAITEMLAVANILLHWQGIELVKEVTELGVLSSIACGIFFLNKSEQLEVAKLRRSAFQDGLTELYNQAFFRQAAQQKFGDAQKNYLPLSLIILDIDDFKSYNDDFGHEAGNIALKNCAAELRRLTRAGDLVARYGGEEFIILVDADLDAALMLAERICQGIATSCQPKYSQGLKRQITVSVGLASLNEKMETLEHLIETADTELYRAKLAGKNRVHYNARFVA